jgi:acyl-CoA synthetase (AMP-forming)/AMP-acid ligase II
VSCGRSLDDQQITVVHPESLDECGPGQIGEICVSGASVARGYWHQPEQTDRTLRAHLPGVRERTFLRTGDLGFLHEGQVFVTGRLKDLIIIDGRNHYPQDIEETVEAAALALQPGGCAAVGIDADGEERLVIIAEMRRPGPDGYQTALVDDVVRAIRRAVVQAHGIEVHAIRLLGPGGMLKTSSGKLRRRACRDAFLTGALTIVGGAEHV